MIDSSLRSAFDEGVTVITATARLARELRWQDGRERQSRGERAWPTPGVLPWSVWLAERWRWLATEADPLLLQPVQVRALWEQIVEQQCGARSLLDPRALAATAADAWSLLHAYRLPWRDLDWPASPEFAAFACWADAFQRACDDRRAVDAARLPDALMARRERLAGERLLLAGFEPLTPQQQQLLGALREVGAQVRMWQPAPRRGAWRRLCAIDPEEELLAAAHWIRRRLETAVGEPPRIGLIVPDLAQRRAQVARLLGEILTPAAELPGLREAQAAFNLAHGEPLCALALVDTAFAWLELIAGPLRWERLSILLRSPYLSGGIGEADSRALLDARLRQLGFYELRLTELAREAGRAGGCVPQLERLLQKSRPLADRLRGRLPAAAWSERIDAALEASGWPGDRPLTSGEYQAVQRWRRLLGEFAALDGFLGELGYGQAVQQLHRLAARSPFQPETPPNAVDVLDWQDANGLRFDHLWLAGLHDARWPPAPQPNPLLPVPLQRRFALPWSSAELAVQQARRWLVDMQRAAGEGLASWPAAELDRSLRPSPLIEAWPMAGLAELVGEALPRYRQSLLGRERLEPLLEDPAPPLPTRSATGGARVLALQAACPFRAFAERRLGARPLERAEPGLGPRRRGVLAHRSLELLWQELGGSTRLLQLGPAGRATQVRAAIERAWAELPYASRLPRRLTTLEQERLAGALESLLEAEAARRPFTIEALEQRRDVEIGPLHLEVRLDRVDRVESGVRLLIDYKTGPASPRAWFGHRIAEPQLPLYAVTSEEEVDGVGFARLRAGEIGYAGFGRQPGCGPGWSTPGDAGEADSDWRSLVAYWRRELVRLAEEFARGEARVDPATGACRHCHLATLCRIHERPGGKR